MCKNRVILRSLDTIKNSKMKNLVLMAIVAISVVSCGPKSEKATAVDSHQFGISYDSTAQMDAIKATFKDIEAYDTASYVTKYADTAVFHDNGKKTNLSENVSLQKQFIALGIKVKVKDDYAMWSNHFSFKDGTEGDFVYAYLTVTFTKGDKSVDVVMFQADEFNKEGKIIEEWMVYDQSEVAQLLK